jgi:phenylalanyl-tRNA synthetase alpha chain
LTPPDREVLFRDFETQLAQATTPEGLNELRIVWAGRKEGKLTLLLRELGKISNDERKTVGPLLNALKNDVETALDQREKALSKALREKTLETDRFDITLPGRLQPVGHIHPISQVMESLVSIFRSLGFVVADGPEMESEFHNFEALNVPADHPARDMQDTFYLEMGPQQLTLPHVDRGASQETVLLRTHTSPVQVRIMQQYPPPIAVVVPGRVYRHEAQDTTHSAVFHQMEGLLVDKNLSFSDLKGTLARFAELFFGPDTRTRFRPSFFPFTEPSAEMDVYFERPGRPAGWIEVMGSGMVHPNVLRSVGVDPSQYNGFAFGMGIERLAMIKHGVEDLRLFQENDVRFLRQF